jgi:hypothetical protein
MVMGMKTCRQGYRRLAPWVMVLAGVLSLPSGSEASGMDDPDHLRNDYTI